MCITGSINARIQILIIDLVSYNSKELTVPIVDLFASFNFVKCLDWKTSFKIC